MSSWAEAIGLLQQQRPADARTLLQSHPLAHAEQDFLLGVCAHALDEIPQAIRHFAKSLQQDGRHARAAAALGALLAGQGQQARAEELLRAFLSQHDDAQVRFNLAVILEDTGRTDDAIREYGHILAMHPQDHAARHNRAGLYARLMKLGEAAADYRELIRHHPDRTLPWQNLADIEISQGQYDAALQRLEEVLRREPGNAKAMLSAAVAAAASGQFAASDRFFEHLQKLDPALWQGARDRINGRGGNAHRPEPHLIFLVRQHEHLSACDWSRWPLYGDVFQQVCQQPGQGELLSLAFRAVATPMDARSQKQLSVAIAGQQASIQAMRPAPAPAPERLRVGYLGSAFGHHATGILLRDLPAVHDPDAVDVCLLDLGQHDGSDTATRLRRDTRVISLQGLDDETAATRIADLGLDILVDLCGYNDDPRPGILSRHPAAVQVSWLAAPYTSGAPWMDYFISDPHVRPGDGWCTEAEAQMPHSYFVFSHDAEPPVPPTRQQLGLPDNRFVYACLNAPFRIDPDTFTIWMRILQQTPDSVLWLLGDSSAVVLNLKREAEWRGIDPRRLLFAPRTTPAAHLARLGAADLYLDTRYCNGHTSVAEALWSGLPVLTCPGETFASRVGGSLLHSCDLPSLVMPDWQHYETQAIALYRERDRLQQLRDHLATTRRHAAPFDITRQARHLESAYRHMRQRFASGHPPESFNVTT